MLAPSSSNTELVFCFNSIHEIGGTLVSVSSSSWDETISQHFRTLCGKSLKDGARIVNYMCW